MKILRMLTAIVSPLLLLPGTSRAAAVIIWPVDPKITVTERATALWIENKGNEPITMQVRTLRWSQGPQGDLYDDQDEIVASPPIAVMSTTNAVNTALSAPYHRGRTRCTRASTAMQI